MNKNRCLVYVIIILSLICVNIPIFALIIDVPADQPTIQAGIDAAKNGDTVLIADGIYRGAGNVNIDFMGKQITVKSLNGAKATIIDCGRKAETRGFTFQNEETHDSVLEGFTIKNGVHELGGGIYCNNASPTIKNCVIAWNKAVKNDRGTGRGGGIYCFNSDAKLIDSTISNNRAESTTYGGGVYFDGNTIIDGVILRETSFHPSLLNCTISDNTGSGVYIQSDARSEIRDSKILHNSRRGIICTTFSRGGTLITNCEISQNSGGVQVSEFSIVEITDSIIRQNTAREGGGIYCSPSATVEISNCIIAQNIATLRGGGIGVFDSRWGSGVEISHCTITRNSASERGGGIYVYSQISFRLTDSIVWGNNSDKTHDEIFLTGRGIVIKSNDIRDGLDGIGREPDGDLFIYEDNIDKDPLFVDADREDYRLKHNSPAKNMGPQTSVVGTLSVVPRGKQLVTWADIKRR